MAIKAKKLYVCSECGGEHISWSGKCSYCGRWNTLKELNISPEKGPSVQKAQVKKLSSVEIRKGERMPTGISEADLVFGGGIVEGSVLLLGGHPGIGKSTLVWQISAAVKGKVLYIAGEESPEQIKLRSQRLKTTGDNIFVIDNSDINSWLDNLKSDEYKLLIIDSIQTIFDSSIASSAGSIMQLKQCTLRIIKKAKEIGLSTIIIGHVTKEGEVAGPKTLEHLVDGVFYLEGEKYSSERFLRSQKNRFGPTEELGVFELTEKGLVAKADFGRLKTDQEVPVGVARTAVAEGSRIYMVEVQSLVQKTSYGLPRRNAVGFDFNRLQMIIAVMGKHTKIDLSGHDVFLNISEGYKLKEPSADMAVVMSLGSSYFDKSASGNEIFVGETDLAGRVHLQGQVKKIVKTCQKLGFKIPNPTTTDLEQFIKKSLKVS